jgi:flagellar biosynthesis protein FliQ
MTVSFDGFDLGSYLLGAVTPLVVALVVAIFQAAKQQRKRKR